MHLLGRHHIAAHAANPALAAWLSLFVTEIMHANWKREHDVTDYFPRSIRQIDGTFRFPIENTGNWLSLAFCFQTGTAVVLSVTLA